MKTVTTALSLLLVIAFSVAVFSKNNSVEQSDSSNQPALHKKKVLYVNSYHSGYEWSDGIAEGLAQTFRITQDKKGNLDNSTGLVNLKIVEMDTKRNKSEAFKKQAALEANNVIAEWQPDVVVVSDDNAVKYLVEPFLNDTDLPVVFCGVNWSLEDYILATNNNITGMIEVQLIRQILGALQDHASGSRVAFLKGDDLSARKEAVFFERRFNLQLDKRFVKDFVDWKKQYLTLQQDADMILLGNSASVKDWDTEDAQAFVLANTTVPSGNWDAWMAPYSLVTFANNPMEQGEWAATTALKILDGTPPSEIPVVTNRKAAIYLNMPLAKKLDIKFPIEMIERATFTSEMGLK